MAARSTFKISDAVRDVLARATITATTVQLPDGQLERKLYQQVNKALEGAGGKWNKQQKLHVFERDPRELLGLAVETGQATNIRTELQAFYTPPPLAKRVVAAGAVAGCIKHGMAVLEPSCGEGALVVAALAHAAVTVVMYDTDEFALKRASEAAGKAIAESGGSMRAEQCDFLAVTPSPTFDAVLMNPPFTGGVDIAHVTHAWGFVRPGGALVAIMSPHFQHAQSKAAVGFRALLKSLGIRAEAEDIEPGTFEHTGIATVLVLMRKPATSQAG